MDNASRMVSMVIKTGSYTGIGLLFIGFILELINNFVRINNAIQNTFALSGIVVLIFTPIFSMLSIAVYFACRRQWKWSIASAFVSVLIIITFITVK
jgi:hypothetical protein